MPVPVPTRYRYYEEAPESLTVPLLELLERLPADCRTGFLPEETGGIELPCRELFSGNTPRLALGTLCALLPEVMRLPEGGDRERQVSLPAGWLAAHYRLVAKREEIPSEDTTGDAGTAREDTPAKGETVLLPPNQTNQRIEIAETKEIAGRKASVPDLHVRTTSCEVAVKNLPPIATATADAEETTENPANGWRGVFASMPIFRRKHGDEQPQIIPKEHALPEQAEVEALEAVVLEHEEPLKNTQDTTTTLALEKLWKLDPRDQLTDPSALQALFMTDEKLTLEQVITLAGQLPGLDACVLAHGEQVVCASNAAAGVDLRNLSAQAMVMLGQIRESSARMGLGKVPSVTLHADRGIVSFLHNDELCLMVLHADRGFVPGVRERLQEVLTHLTTARALPGRKPGLADLQS